jgi:hypothetical protein
MASKLSVIQSGIISVIESMTVSGGYNYDWTSTQQEDFNKVTSWPHANVYLEPEEISSDDVGIPNMSSYRNTTYFQLHCYHKLDEESTNSTFDIDYILNDMLHDIKKGFGSNPTLDGEVYYVAYKGSRRMISGQGEDIFLPKKLIVRLEVDYAQDRTEPINNAYC